MYAHASVTLLVRARRPEDIRVLISPGSRVAHTNSVNESTLELAKAPLMSF